MYVSWAFDELWDGRSYCLRPRSFPNSERPWLPCHCHWVNYAHKLLEIYYGHMCVKDSVRLEVCLRISFSSSGYYFVMADTRSMFDVEHLNTIKVGFLVCRVFKWASVEFYVNWSFLCVELIFGYSDGSFSSSVWCMFVLEYISFEEMLFFQVDYVRLILVYVVSANTRCWQGMIG